MPMTLPTDAAFVAAWNPLSRAAPQQRLARLLETAVPAGDLAQDTLGDRNLRLLALHDAWIGRALGAQVTCGCGTVSAFDLPVAALRDLAVAGGREVMVAGRRFRLPRMADVGDDLAALAEACALEGGAVLTGEALQMLEAAWAEADPAAVVEVETTCPACGAALRAVADVADFVARDLDARARAMLRSIDALARAYGWREAEILALPDWRRRAYLAMVEGPRAEPLPGAVRRRGR